MELSREYANQGLELGDNPIKEMLSDNTLEAILETIPSKTPTLIPESAMEEVTLEASETPIDDESQQEDLDAYETTTKIPYTEENVQILSEIMTAEGECMLSNLSLEEAERGLKLIGSVAIHRTETNFEGATTLLETVYAVNDAGQIQYAERTQNLIGNIEVPEQIYQWAEELLKNGAYGPDNLVFAANFQQGEYYDYVGGMYFGLS